jgi:hypothetical protein
LTDKLKQDQLELIHDKEQVEKEKAAVVSMREELV